MNFLAQVHLLTLLITMYLVLDATFQPEVATVNMIPAKTQCLTVWTREYYGYLTIEHESHYRSSYNCVDIDSENMGSRLVMKMVL